jgi:serine/threonine protein kinase
VHKVRERRGGSVRALKILTSETPNAPRLLARLQREAELAGQLRHHNIARVHGFEQLGDGAGYVEMELLEGRRLDELATAGTLPSIGLSVEIGRQALAALAALHRRRLVHCDVSLDNLVLTMDEEGGPQVKLLDLGVATETGQLPDGGYPGKPDGAPPEHLGPQPRPVEPADDLYGLAVVLYEFVTGKHPFPGRVGTVVPGGEGRQAPLDLARTDPAGRVPSDLRKILLRALAEEPGGRYTSAIELSDALAQVGMNHRFSDKEVRDLLAAGAPQEPPPPVETPAAEVEEESREKTETLELGVLSVPEPEPPEPPEPIIARPPPSPWQPPEPPRRKRGWLWLLLAAAAAAAAVAVVFMQREPRVKHTLTVDRAGGGSGRVTSSPAGIDCGEDCRHAFGEGTQVRLTAVAAPGSVFAGWSPELTDDRVALTADRALTATFDPVPTHALSVAKTGDGSGRVTSEPAGIDCGDDCQGDFTQDSSVRLIPTPAAGSVFAGWSPALPDGLVTMAADRSYTATFRPAPPGTLSLTVRRTGDGSGRVTSSPAGIDCGEDCRYAFSEGTAVRLIASADPGSVFAGWSPAITGDTVTLTADRTLTATFQPSPTHTLIVSKLGQGSGRVTSSPAGIDCGDDCEGQFTQGSPVRLSATPGAGSAFTGWSPAIDDDTVTLTGDLNLIATFRPAPTGKVSLTVRKTGAGSGRVTSSPDGIDCGEDCRQAFEKGTSIRLTPTAEPGSIFAGWSSEIVADTVVLKADRTVTAAFEPAPLQTFTLTIDRTGTGSGRVTSSPAGIDCGTDCEESYAEGTVVQLTAEPEPGSQLDGWSPALSDGTVTLAADQTYTASFQPAPDREPPVARLVGSEYKKKKEDALLIFEINDDEGVVEATAYVRQGETSSPRTFPLEADEDREDVFSLVVPADFHQGADIHFWVTAEDAAGNVGTLASKGSPQRVERRGFFERGENWLQDHFDKLRGKKD